MISIPVSIGELIDKITILEIKINTITNIDALGNIKFELTKLENIAKEFECTDLKTSMSAINQELWNTEDAVRECERTHDFGEKFISLARNVYHKNDERARIKRMINERFNSAIVEEKSYSAY